MGHMFRNESFPKNNKILVDLKKNRQFCIKAILRYESEIPISIGIM